MVKKSLLVLLIILFNGILYSQVVTYTRFCRQPDLASYDADGYLISGIHYDIAISTMTNKGIDYCLWNEYECNLLLEFYEKVNAEDLAILNIIVENYR